MMLPQVHLLLKKEPMMIIHLSLQKPLKLKIGRQQKNTDTRPASVILEEV